MKNKVVDYISLNDAREIYFPEKSKSWIKMQIHDKKIPAGALKYFGKTAFLSIDYLNRRFGKSYTVPLEEDEKAVKLEEFYSSGEIYTMFSRTTTTGNIKRKDNLPPEKIVDADGNTGIKKAYMDATYLTIHEQIKHQIEALSRYSEEEKEILYKGATLAPQELLKLARRYLDDNNAHALYLLIEGSSTQYKIGLVKRK